MKYYLEAYLDQLSKEELQSKSLREILRGFYVFLEGEGILLTSGKGAEKVRNLSNQVHDLSNQVKEVKDEMRECVRISREVL